MPLSEILIVKVGEAVAKAILKTWLSDAGTSYDVGKSTIEIIGQLSLELASRRKLEREFHEIADRIGTSLVPFFEAEGARLSEGDKKAVSLALAAGINRTNLDASNLTSNFDLRTTKLGSAIRKNANDETVSFSQDALALLARAADESARYIIEVSARLPTFSPAVFGEILERQRKIGETVDEVLGELKKVRETTLALNPVEEMARFEQRYRIAISHHNDEVELFGLDAPSKIRRQNLGVAYVTLSMQKKEGRKPREVHPVHILDRNVAAVAASVFERAEIKKLVDWTADANNESRALLSKALSTKGIFARSKSAFTEVFKNWLVHSDAYKCDHILNGSPRLLIRGEAGSGKTTLLQWVAVNAASQRLTGVLNEWNEDLPFLIKLREYAEKELPTPSIFAKAAAPEIADTMPIGWAEHVMSEGRAIILIDGVDELDLLKRNEVRDWVHQLVGSYSKCRYILTSRPIAIEEDWLRQEGFEEAELLPMSWGDIDNLVDHWHEALAAQSSVPETRDQLKTIAEQLKAQLRKSRPLSELATSPLLCAMLCALHYQRRQQLPPSRIALYEAAIRMLLDQRDRARGIKNLRLPDLTEEQKKAFLERLAYRMMRNGFATVPISDAIAEIERTMVTVKNLPPAATAKLISDLLIFRSGIIRSPVEGQLDFVHKTFQEFLCAKAIVDEDDLKFLVEQANKDLWHETVVLAAGIAPLAKRNEFFRLLIERGDQEYQARHSLYLLAVACLETAVQLSPEIVALLDSKLQAVIPPKSMTEARSLRAAGKLAVPLLKRKSQYSARVAAASVRALSMIGGDEALHQIETYSGDHRKTVIRELIESWQRFDRIEYAKLILANSPLENGRVAIRDSESLRGTQYLKNLISLVIFDSAIKDLSAIRYSKNIRRLVLHSLPALTSLEPMSELSKIEALSLENLPLLENVDPLSGHKSITSLEIEHCAKLRDLAAVSSLKELTALTIRQPVISPWPILELAPNLTSLTIPRLTISDFAFVERYKKLSQLECRCGDHVENERALGNASELRQLSIYNASFKSMEWTSKLDKLQLLTLHKPKGAIQLSALYSLKSCLFIDIDNDGYLDLAALANGSRRLEHLSLTSCQLDTKLPNLEVLKEVKQLRLTRLSGLRDISNITTLSNLRYLLIIDCKEIEDYSPIKQLKNVMAYVPDQGSQRWIPAQSFGSEIRN